MLTVAASMIGVNAEVRIKDEWSEPSILWQLGRGRIYEVVVEQC
jgi:hypothetical protein